MLWYTNLTRKGGKMVRSFSLEESKQLVINVLTKSGEFYEGYDMLDQSLNGIEPVTFWAGDELVGIPMSEVEEFRLYVKKKDE